MRYLTEFAVLLMLSVFVATACTTVDTVRLGSARGMPTMYEDPSSPGRVTGIGLESQDIVSVTDKMVRDMLANPMIAGRATPPRVVIDSEYFRNESSCIINKNIITDRLRTELNRAANGRIVFIGRHYSDMVEKERALEQEGVVTEGTIGPTQKALGWDYRLGGRIASITAVDARTGLTSIYYQITFEMVERGTGVIVWSGTYSFKKIALDDIIYI